MPESRANIVALMVGVGSVLISTWYAAAPVRANRTPERVGAPSDPNSSAESHPSDPERSLDRSVFDIVLWHDPPPPPSEPEQPAVVRAAPPPQVDLLAITRTPSGFEAVFYEKNSDRLHTVKAEGQLGSYRISAIGSTWVRLDFSGRETTLELDQPRIAAREGRVSDE